MRLARKQTDLRKRFSRNRGNSRVPISLVIRELYPSIKPPLVLRCDYFNNALCDKAPKAKRFSVL